MEAAAATTEDSREGVQKSLASWLVLRGHVSELSSDVAAHTALESFGLSDSPPQQEFADAPVFEPKPRTVAAQTAKFSAALHAGGEFGGPCLDGCPLLASFDDGSCFGGNDKVASCLTNSACVVRPLEDMLARAHRMFDAGAYVHQYEARGVERAAFEDAFTCLEQVAVNYKSL